MQSEGYAGDYFAFLKLYLDTSTTLYADHQLLSNRTGIPFGLITYNHLWYLLYLFSYTLVYIAIKPVLTKINWQKITEKSGAISVVLIPVSLLLAYNILLSPYFPETFVLINDWDTENDFIKYDFCYPIIYSDSLVAHPIISYQQMKRQKALKATYHGNYIYSINRTYK